MLSAILCVPLTTIMAVQNADRATIEKARRDGLPAQIAGVIADVEQPIATRLHAARALARLGGAPALAALTPLAAADETPEDQALARESARALKQLRAAAQLTAAVDSRDPEVRALAASAGAAPSRLCALLKDDPWPAVRAAAADGLGRTPAAAACLGVGLSDAHPAVRTAAARSATKARLPALRTALRKLAGDAGAPLAARAEAFSALAVLGDLEPAHTVLKTHLKDGAIEPLALAAVRAFAHAEQWKALQTALESTAPAVVTTAARSLLNTGIPAHRAAVQARQNAADAPLRARLARLQRELAPAVPPDPDPPGMNWD